jgi:hypothetical protein
MSLGAIEGAACVRSVMAGIESAPVKTRHHEAFWAIESNWRPDPSHLCVYDGIAQDDGIAHGPVPANACPGRENDDKSL